MDFKETFLQLTEFTIPYGHEDTVAHLLPKGVQRDKKGNYFITVGEGGTTLFTSHLDTVSSKRQKVNHVIKKNGTIIATDGKTILGGDNKAGVCILMYLIEQGVPGTYYFFVGEEIGAVGSKWALEKNRDFFSQFKRAVAFDRKKYGSIITNQRGCKSTSDKFAITLSEEFKKQGMYFNPDKYGIFTDTAIFMGVIPECTNISSGVFNEHFKDEYVDIAYTEAVAIASAKINWDELPSVRKPKNLQRDSSYLLGRNSHYPTYGTSYATTSASTTSTFYGHGQRQQPYTNNTLTCKPKIKKVTMQEAMDMAVEKIKDMVYKQEVYKKYVDIKTLMFNPFFKDYKYSSNTNIDEIITWMEGKDVRKPAIYEMLKPYLSREFWNERLTHTNIMRKVEMLSDIKIVGISCTGVSSSNEIKENNN